MLGTIKSSIPWSSETNDISATGNEYWILDSGWKGNNKILPNSFFSIKNLTSLFLSPSPIKINKIVPSFWRILAAASILSISCDAPMFPEYRTIIWSLISGISLANGFSILSIGIIFLTSTQGETTTTFLALIDFCASKTLAILLPIVTTRRASSFTTLFKNRQILTIKPRSASTPNLINTSGWIS